MPSSCQCICLEGAGACLLSEETSWPGALVGQVWFDAFHLSSTEETIPAELSTIISQVNLTDCPTCCHNKYAQAFTVDENSPSLNLYIDAMLNRWFYYHFGPCVWLYCCKRRALEKQYSPLLYNSVYMSKVLILSFGLGKQGTMQWTKPKVARTERNFTESKVLDKTLINQCDIFCVKLITIYDQQTTKHLVSSLNDPVMSILQAACFKFFCLQFVKHQLSWLEVRWQTWQVKTNKKNSFPAALSQHSAAGENILAVMVSFKFQCAQVHWQNNKNCHCPHDYWACKISSLCLCPTCSYKKRFL